MRIGIYLGDFTPDVGGGFTFQDDVFCAFANVAAQSRHQFFVMGSAGNLSGYVKSVAVADNLQAVTIVSSYSDRRKEALKSYSPLLRRLLGAGPVERASEKLGLDCLWYVAGGAYEATDVPYVATVWDLQHRTMPWYPELSAGGTWDARELSYRRFLQRATYVITGTEVGLTEIGTYYQITRERIRVLPHPTPRFVMQDLTDVDTGIRTRMGLSEPYLLYPAQFWPHKNHANLLCALRILRDSHNL